jgi:hypothetical protein
MGTLAAMLLLFLLTVGASHLFKKSPLFQDCGLGLAASFCLSIGCIYVATGTAGAGKGSANLFAPGPPFGGFLLIAFGSAILYHLVKKRRLGQSIRGLMYTMGFMLLIFGVPLAANTTLLLCLKGNLSAPAALRIFAWSGGLTAIIGGGLLAAEKFMASHKQQRSDL